MQPVRQQSLGNLHDCLGGTVAAKVSQERAHPHAVRDRLVELEVESGNTPQVLEPPAQLSTKVPLGVSERLDHIPAFTIIPKCAHGEPCLAQIRAHPDARYRRETDPRILDLGDHHGRDLLAKLLAHPLAARAASPGAKRHAFCCSMVKASRMSPSRKSLKSARVMPQSYPWVTSRTSSLKRFSASMRLWAISFESRNTRHVAFLVILPSSTCAPAIAGLPSTW